MGLLLILPVFAIFSSYITDRVVDAVLALLAALGLFLIAAVWRDKTTLEHDSIVQIGVFSSKQLRRQDIRAYRKRSVRGTPFLELLPADTRLKSITVTRIALEDPAFIAWLRGFEDLNATDMAAFDLALVRDDSLNGTLDERKAQVKQLKETSSYLTWAYIALLTFALFYPHPAWLLVLATVAGPWLAIALLAMRGRDFTILGTGTALLRKGSLFQFLILPAFFIYIVFSVAIDGGPRLPLEWPQLFVPSFIGALFMTTIVWIVSSYNDKLPYRASLKIVLPLLVYCGGSLALINSVFDHDDATMFTLKVQEKHRTSGKGATNYLGVVSDDAAYGGDTSIRASAKVYGAAVVGGPICASIHPGFLHLRWESIAVCNSVPSPRSAPAPVLRESARPIAPAYRQAAIVMRQQTPPITTADKPVPATSPALAITPIESTLAPLDIHIGDNLATVRRILKTDASLIPMRRNRALPANVPDMMQGRAFIRLIDQGIWVFFDQQGAAYCIRLDAPFSGEIKGIQLGDDLAKLTATLGRPRMAPTAFGNTVKYRYPLDEARHVAFDVNAQGVQIMFITD